jgi:hypothetical protein
LNSLRGNGIGIQSVLIRNSVSLPNGWAETVTDSIDDGGLVLRFSDNQHYYLLALRDDGARNTDNLEIFRRNGAGQAGFVSLWRMNVTWPRGTSRRVRFEATGDSLRVFFDGQRVGAIRDAAPLAGGGIGLRHYGDSASWISRYRRLSWGQTPAPTLNPEGEESFPPGALSSYSGYSDGGEFPWSIGSNSLLGNGIGLQSVLIRNSVSLPDGWVETFADSIDDGGLVLRFFDNEHYYVLAIRDDQALSPRNSDNLQIYRRTGAGQAGFVSLWRMNVTWPRGTSRRVRFEAAADSLRVFLDGQRVGAVRDTANLAGGGIGVRHYGASESWISRYRNLRWGQGN